MSGGKCPTIIGLKLDRDSIAAITDLKTTMQGLNIAGVVISFSLVVDMFFSRNVPTVAVNIYSSEWELFAESMAAIPKIHRGYIVKVADLQILRLYKDQKQQKFWEGVKNGCSY
jgi:hypothetical protein